MCKALLDNLKESDMRGRDRVEGSASFPVSALETKCSLLSVLLLHNQLGQEACSQGAHCNRPPSLRRLD